MTKFIKLSDLKLKTEEMKEVKGGNTLALCYGVDLPSILKKLPF